MDNGITIFLRLAGFFQLFREYVFPVFSTLGVRSDVQRTVFYSGQSHTFDKSRFFLFFISRRELEGKSESAILGKGS